MSRPAGTSQEAWDAASDIVVDYGNRTGTVVVSLQAPIARAIDAAILSAKAEQREADAKLVDAAAAARRARAADVDGKHAQAHRVDCALRAAELDEVASAIRAGV